jgi:hypothetical protein
LFSGPNCAKAVPKAIEPERPTTTAATAKARVHLCLRIQGNVRGDVVTADMASEFDWGYKRHFSSRGSYLESIIWLIGPTLMLNLRIVVINIVAHFNDKLNARPADHIDYSGFHRNKIAFIVPTVVFRTW